MCELYHLYRIIPLPLIIRAYIIRGNGILWYNFRVTRRPRFSFTNIRILHCFGGVYVSELKMILSQKYGHLHRVSLSLILNFPHTSLSAPLCVVCLSPPPPPVPCAVISLTSLSCTSSPHHNLPPPHPTPRNRFLLYLLSSCVESCLDLLSLAPFIVC